MAGIIALTLLVIVAHHQAAATTAAAAGGHLMAAVLPAGSVPGIGEELTVTEEQLPPPPPPPAPAVYTVTFATDVKPEGGGEIPVLVTRSWAPLGADRFYAAVQAGFYNQSAFFRVVAPNSSGCHLTCGGIVQFGISGNRSLNAKWLNSPIKDDPVTQVRAVAWNIAYRGPLTVDLPARSPTPPAE